MISSVFDGLFGLLSTTVPMLITALLLDRFLGEPKSWHPLVWFGHWVDGCRKRLQSPLSLDQNGQRLFGVFAWCCAVFPWLIFVLCLQWTLPQWIVTLFSIVIVYFSIGWQSLREHALDIITPLHQGDLARARVAVGHIVSRDTSTLNETDIAKAGTESILENGSDAIFAPIFWFVILGVPGVLLYRLSNTLDAMWGYKTKSLLHFGWFAARFDDAMNYIPARLVAYTYAVCGNWSSSRRCAIRQGPLWKSGNAGTVMAAGAGALDVELGGSAPYFGKIEERPVLGEGDKPTSRHLEQAVLLIDKSVYLWGLLLCLFI